MGLDGLTHPVAEPLGRVQGGAGEEEHELLAAVPPHAVDLAGLGAQHVGELLEHGVAGLVAVRVVHALELVEVAHEERERLAQAARAFGYDGGEVRRTVSIGVSAWPHPDLRHQEALVKAADDALYVAKESGRNRVVAYGSPAFRGHVRAEVPEDAQAASR